MCGARFAQTRQAVNTQTTGAKYLVRSRGIRHIGAMIDFTIQDSVAVGIFLVTWYAYHTAVESSRLGHKSLNQLIHTYRMVWMERMLARDVRIIDTQITAGLQNGTSFFASTSLFAIGGSLTLLRATDDVINLFADLPLGLNTSRTLWEIKVMGLAMIFTYAFFKFAWAYRLFNYAAILIGATPPPQEVDTATAQRFVHETGAIFTEAGRHFNRGQRGLFFSLAYIGWFASPYVLLVTTAAIVVMLVRRQFTSPAHAAAENLTVKTDPAVKTDESNHP